MSFSYQFGENPPIDYPRLLIADTQEFGPDGVTPAYIFQDSEILSAARICTLNWQSGMFYSGVQGANLPASPVSYYRVAAVLLDALSANKARLANALKVLDIQVNTQSASQELRTLAASYREVDDNAGAIMIIEQVNDAASFRERFWKTVQRASAA